MKTAAALYDRLLLAQDGSPEAKRLKRLSEMASKRAERRYLACLPQAKP